MRGSLDNPPIVVAISRWLPGLMMPLPMAITVFSIWMIMYDPSEWRSYLFAGIFGGFTFFVVRRFLSPPRLEISAQGLGWFKNGTVVRYDWQDFADFRAYLPNRGFFENVGYDYAPDSPKRRMMPTFALAIVPYVAAGVDCGFGGPWEIPADDVASLLNQARAKWS